MSYEQRLPPRTAKDLLEQAINSSNRRMAALDQELELKRDEIRGLEETRTTYEAEIISYQRALEKL